MSDTGNPTKVWIPEAENTVVALWGKVPPHEIARIINLWNKRVQIIERGYKSFSLLSGNSVIDRAFRLNIITESEMIEHKKVERARRRKSKSNLLYQAQELRNDESVTVSFVPIPDSHYSYIGDNA